MYSIFRASIVLLITILITVGCKSNDNSYVVNYDGNWTSISVLDSNQSLIEDAQYQLYLTQNLEGGLKGILNIEDDIFTSEIEVSGSVNLTGFYLSGYGGEYFYELRGASMSDPDSVLNTTLTKMTLDKTTIVEVKDIFFEKQSLSDAYTKPPTVNTYELTNICGEGNSESIILVHGFISNSGTWNNFISRYEQANYCKKYALWTYQYNWYEHIDDSAQDMLDRINANSSIQNPPIFIAHSMGGLVTRSYITKGGDFKHLVTLGTPNEGAELSAIKDWLIALGVITHIPIYAIEKIVKSYTDMAPSSDFMRGLSSSQIDQNARSNYYAISGEIKLDSSCSLYCWKRCCCCWHKYYWAWNGSYPPYILGTYELLSKPNDGIVEYSSSSFSGDDRVEKATYQGIYHVGLTDSEAIEDDVLKLVDTWFAN